ncbi:MAG TPA: serine/threonine-protein kinase [Gemmataceae bacterium]|nr:serine/threonine-protein kinase [Gemmataceae bacterium]
MSDDSRVEELLEELLDSGGSPEEVCRACPDLLPQVRAGWRRLRALHAQVVALFPETTLLDDVEPDGATPHPPPAALPRIPGYEVQAVLGHGGMGVVYKAWHVRLHRAVALKMLLAGPGARPEELERFLREAEAVAGLRHPNIVQIHDIGDLDGRPYFTMEFVEGGSLARKLAGTPQSAREAAALTAALAEAVHAAHQSGIVHRDLKPANVLLTADGTPKIADFGLARRLEGGAGLTQSGAAVGTPSYMAPEQAQGKTGRAADIYALGAILYELLTGRPPFRAETAVETVLQVLHQEPVPPSRLNAKTPRDLETICLKCLRKDPQRRYAAAAALADDLRRFQRGEPVRARPASLPSRLAKWARRRPTHAAMLAVGLLFIVALVAGGVWLALHQAERRRLIEADLKDVATLQEQARWTAARAALERAAARLDGSVSDDLRGRIDQSRRDLDLATQLDAVQLRRETRSDLPFYDAQAAREYAEAFQKAGLGKLLDPPERVAAMVNASAVRKALVEALDDWSVRATDKEERAWLLEALKRADPDPEGWRARVPAAWEDAGTLAELARTAPVERLPESMMLAIGRRLRAFRRDAAPFLRRVQQAHPGDFWPNLILGDALLQGNAEQAAGYYRAALASRPTAAVGYCAVGDALRYHDDLDAAIDYYHKALQFDPNFARAHNNLGLSLQAQDQLDEAMGCFQKAAQLDPDYAWAHLDLGNLLRAKGRLDEAYDQFQEVLRLDPTNREVRDPLRSILVRRGRVEEVQAEWRKAIDADPSQHDTWFGYAEFCLFLGQPEEYRRVRRALLDRFGATTDPYTAEPVGRACLLLPASEEELQQAAALADRAVAAKGSTPAWIYRYFLFAKGLAEYRQGRYDSAIALMKGEASLVMGPSPRVIAAMAQYRNGQEKQARKTLALAVVGFDWSAADADRRDIWIAHILRREAEALILPDLPAFLRGEYQPRDDDEGMALVGACQFQGLDGSAARLYADAFTADPNLAEDLAAQCLRRTQRSGQKPGGVLENLNSECRYPAVRCAALAGCGFGKDAAMLSEAERTRWRRQARNWLRADLALWDKMLSSDAPAARDLAEKMLRRWQIDPDLAGLREPGAMDALPADERAEWVALWREVGAALDRAHTTR